ncbi:MAG: hypothetical protein WAQ05_07715 [Rubrivivax sp.]
MRLMVCYGPVRVGMELESDAQRDWLVGVLSPTFEISAEPVPAPCDTTLRVQMRGARNLDALDRAAIHRSPCLRFDPSEPLLHLASFSEASKLVYATDGGDRLLYRLEAVPADGVACLELFDDGPAGWRLLARMVKSIIGIHAQRKSMLFVHAAAMQLRGRGHLLLGPKGSGKSSLCHLAGMTAGAAIVSDDMVTIESTPGGLVARGWPNRIAVGESLLQALYGPDLSAMVQGLRRPTIPARSENAVLGDWHPDRRVRHYYDQDEFVERFGVCLLPSMTVDSLVLPHCSPLRTSVEIERFEGDSADAVCDNLAEPRQTKYMTDYLGLYGGDPIRWSSRGTCGEFAGLGCVTLHYGPSINRGFPDHWLGVEHLLAEKV